MTTYQPTATRVLLKVLPITDGSIQIPDHLKSTVAMQRFQIQALGPVARNEAFPLEVGQVVLICAHPSLLTGVSKDDQLCCVDRADIAVVISESEAGQN